MSAAVRDVRMLGKDLIPSKYRARMSDINTDIETIIDINTVTSYCLLMCYDT